MRKTPATPRPHEEVVQGVADQDQVGEGLPAGGGGAVAVVPVQQLLQEEKESKTPNHIHVDSCIRANFLNGLGNHMKKCTAKQRTCR
jgi:hypothetical protein